MKQGRTKTIKRGGFTLILSEKAAKELTKSEIEKYLDEMIQVYERLNKN